MGLGVASAAGVTGGGEVVAEISPCTNEGLAGAEKCGEWEECGEVRWWPESPLARVGKWEEWELVPAWLQQPDL